MLAERGLDISTGKMSGLWSGQPSVLRPEELDAFCAVLDCPISELTTAEPDKVPAPPSSIQESARAVGHHPSAGTDPARRITPKRRTGRSLPPR